jgi:glucose-1-phosphate cytidylyltransferase
MIEIGDAPILIHIMRWYYHHGFNDFVICGGYRSWEIKNFLLNYEYRMNHLLIDYRNSSNRAPQTFGANQAQEKWSIRVIDTGLESMTGARIARAYDEVSQHQNFSHFAVTYGDGLSNVNLNDQLSFHISHKKVGTILGVPPVARWGELDVGPTGIVAGFLEKPEQRQSLINGGFFFFNANFRKYLDTNPDCILEKEPLGKLVSDQELLAFKYTGFWHAMDTLRDKVHLQSLWDSGEAPWKVPNQK